MKPAKEASVVMLAAGLGSRLRQGGAARPKCLLELGGRTLLRRHLDTLAALGVKRLHLVLGYAAGQIEAAVAGSPLLVETLFNPRYREGSVISLWTARALADANADLILMDADVLCHADVLIRLLQAPQGNWLQLDRAFAPGEEPVKVCLRGGRIVEFRKRLPADLAFDTQGESTGFFRFEAAMAQRLMRRAQEFIDAGRASDPHEEAIRDLLLEDPEAFQCMDITGLPWMEIDFPEDMERAKELAVRLDS